MNFELADCGMERMMINLVRVVVMGLLVMEAASAQIYTKTKPFRQISSESFSVVVQKNGRVDVTLMDGTTIFDDVQPMVKLVGQEKLVELPVGPAFSTRQEVRNALGQGPGMLFSQQSCAWVVETYVTQPFLTVRLMYVNTGKKAVEVETLYPWYSQHKKGAAMNLGGPASTAVSLDNGSVVAGGDMQPRLHRGAAWSDWNLATWHPRSGRSVIGGFLSNGQARASVKLEQGTGKEDVFTGYAAMCTYDPPVRLEPGEKLTSEVFYVALTEQDPVKGLQRYGRAMAVWDGMEGQIIAPPTVRKIESWEEEVDALSNDMQRFYLGRQYWMQESERELDTGVALLPERFAIRRSVAKDLINELGTGPDSPRAVPLDVFSNEQPGIWHVPVKDDCHVLALFNWIENEEQTIEIPLERLNLYTTKYATVFDKRKGLYLGLADTQISVKLNPGAHRMLALRPYRNRPMVLAVGQSVEDSMRIEDEQWDVSTRVLSGSYRADTNAPWLYFYIPEDFEFSFARMNGEEVAVVQEERSGRMVYRQDTPSKVQWEVGFKPVVTP